MRLYFRRWMHACGLRPGITLRSLAQFPSYFRDYRRFVRSIKHRGWNVALSQPCLQDRFEAGGSASGHYFHQDLFVAQRIYARRPQRHCDVGSRVDGFVAHVASFRSVEYYDVRPITSDVDNIVFRHGDLMDLSSLPRRACDSVSALHVIEHVGLGRYGDRLAADGWEQALTNLGQMLSPGGILYLSVPIGRQRIEFNAHRVFFPSTIVEAARARDLTLEAFAWVDDAGNFHRHGAEPALISPRVDALDYGCGIFEFRARTGAT